MHILNPSGSKSVLKEEKQVETKRKKGIRGGAIRKDRAGKERGGRGRTVRKKDQAAKGGRDKKDRAAERGGGGGVRGGISSRGFRSLPTTTTLDKKDVHSSITITASCTSTNEQVVKELLAESDSESEVGHATSDKKGTQDADPTLPPEGAINKKMRKRRYILFVGNLPKTASREEIVSHFEKRGVHMKEFRLLTHKDTGNSKGCGFMELGCDRDMQNALKFHRMLVGKQHVNIEVTCGGGGKTDRRKAKIKEKNKTLRLKQSMTHPVKHKT